MIQWQLSHYSTDSLLSKYLPCISMYHSIIHISSICNLFTICLFTTYLSHLDFCHVTIYHYQSPVYSISAPITHLSSVFYLSIIYHLSIYPLSIIYHICTCVHIKLSAYFIVKLLQRAHTKMD